MAGEEDTSVLLPTRARRAPKKKVPGPPKPRPPRRRGRKQALHLTDLAPEILEKIVSTLLPPRPDPVNGFLHPREALYLPGKVLFGSNTSSIPERCGSIPGGIMDIVHIGSCCKQLRVVAGKVMSSIGGSRPPQPHNAGDIPGDGVHGRPAKRARLGSISSINGDCGSTCQSHDSTTPTAATVRREVTEMEAAPKKTLYLQEEHCSLEAVNFRELILAHRETLEEVVIYTCRHTVNYGRERSAFMGHMAPLQSDHKDDTPVLPRLQRLQVGPKLCLRCMRAAVHIFCADWTKKEKRETARHIKTFGSYNPDHNLADDDRSGLDPFAYHIEPWGERVDFASPAAPNLIGLQAHYPFSEPDHGFETHFSLKSHTAEQIRMGLKLFSLYVASDDDTEGGFGRNGTCSYFKAKTPLEVEKEIHEAAQTPLLLKQERRTAELARKEALRLKKYKAEVPKLLDAQQAPRLEQAYRIEFNDKGAMTIRNKNDRESSGSPTSASSFGSFSPWSEYGSYHYKYRFGARGRNNSFSDISSMSGHGGSTVADPKDLEQSIDDIGGRGAEESEASLHTQHGEKKRKLMLLRLADAIQTASQLFPNLVGLQILRSGSSRSFIAEEYDLEPLSDALSLATESFTNLRWLDLGLAVVGKREMTDFPLGFTLHKTFIGTLCKEETEYHDRRELAWRERVDRATREGDAWRQTVLDRLVLGKSKEFNPDDCDSPEKAELMAKILAFSRLPSTLEGGHMYTVDLSDRRKRKAVVIPWHRSKAGDEEVVVIGDKERITL